MENYQASSYEIHRRVRIARFAGSLLVFRHLRMPKMLQSDGVRSPC